MLRSLFWRVLLAFLLASVANFVALMVAEKVFEPPRDESREGDARDQQSDALGRLAVALADVAGPEAVEKALSDGDDRVVIHVFGQGLESVDACYADDPVIHDMLARAENSDRGEIRFLPDRFLIAKEIQAGDRKVMLLVDDHTVDPPNPMWNPWARGALAMLVSAVVCFGLVITVTRPVKRLRGVVSRYGRGDLQARYGKVRWRDEIGELGIQFDEMADRVQQLVDAQRRLLRDVSHELRSPLARLQLALGIARNRPENLAETLDRVEHEANRVNDLIRELLTLSRLESAQTEEWEVIELRQLLETIVHDAQFEAQSRNVRVQLSGLEHGQVRASANLLYRALENVVRNAVKYNAAGAAVEVTLESAAQKPGHREFRIRVRDHGPGIPEAELQAVLQPFVRSSEAASQDGVGLGLAIGDRIIRQAGGTLRLANAPGGGLLVEIFLPAAA